MLSLGIQGNHLTLVNQIYHDYLTVNSEYQGWMNPPKEIIVIKPREEIKTNNTADSNKIKNVGPDRVC